ncbi:TrmH family RNA methyltransferase, partial [Klebsiella pneumoniae]
DVLLDNLLEQAVVVVACGIGNHDNMGGLFRNAAAFGVGAVLLDRTCCDPFYRKAIRVSVGAVLRTPMATGLDAEAMVDLLQGK